MSRDTKGVLEVLNHFVEGLMGWMRVNTLKINFGKTQVALVDSSLVVGSGYTLL